MGDVSSAGHRLFRYARSHLERLPGMRRARATAWSLEEALLRALAARLARNQNQNGTPAAAASGEGPRFDCAQRLEALLTASMAQQPEAAARALHRQLVQQLVPDEVRILSALSEGTQVAVCHLEATTRLSGNATRMRSYLSRIGLRAGVMLADQMPYYLAHLQALTLLDAGPEDPAQKQTYELIENDAPVRQLCTEIETVHRRRPRFVRHTLYLSPLGVRLWALRMSADVEPADAPTA